MRIFSKSSFLYSSGHPIDRAKVIARGLFTPKIVHWISTDVKFDLSYGFLAFSENYSRLRPLEIIPAANATGGTKCPVFLFPGFEGKRKFVQPLITNLNRTVICLQYPFEKARPFIPEYVDDLLPLVRTYLDSVPTIGIIAHSFGGLIAMEMIRRLEQENHSVRLCLLDSSPTAMKYMTLVSMGHDKIRRDFDIDYILHFAHCMKIPNAEKLRDLINAEDEWFAKLNTFLEYIPPGHRTLSKEKIHIVVNGLHNAVHAILHFDDDFPRLSSKTALLRSTVRALVPFPPDFEMEKYFVEPVRTVHVKGHHFDMLKYKETADFINIALEEK